MPPEEGLEVVCVVDPGYVVLRQVEEHVSHVEVLLDGDAVDGHAEVAGQGVDLRTGMVVFVDKWLINEYERYKS